MSQGLKVVSTALISALTTLVACAGEDQAEVLADAAAPSSTDASTVDAGADAGAGPPATYTVGGTVSGLAGTGLRLGLGAEALPITQDGPFTFLVELEDGAAYAAEIRTSPQSPSQTCTFAAGATGSIADADVTSLRVECSVDAFGVEVTVAGLAEGALVLQNNGGDDLRIEADGKYTFSQSTLSGSAYAVTVSAQPLNQNCVVRDGSGTVGAGPVALQVECKSMGCVSTATITVDPFTHDVDVHGDHLVVSLGEGYGRLMIYDVSNPAQVTLTSSLALDSSDGCWYAGSAMFAPGGDYVYLYGGGCRGVPVVDVRDRLHPQPLAMADVSWTNGGSMDLAVCGSMAYAAIQSQGVAAVDLTDPSAPLLVDEQVIGGNTYPYKISCSVRDATYDDVYLGDGGSSWIAGLRLYEYNKLTQTLSPRGTYLVSETSWGGAALPMGGPWIYMPYGNPSRLALFDLSDRDNLAEPTFSEIYPNLNARMLRRGQHLIIASGTDIGYYDVSTPALPVPLFRKWLRAGSDRLQMFSAGGRDHLAYNMNGGTTLSLCRVEGLDPLTKANVQSLARWILAPKPRSRSSMRS